jgi:hypothetical protein
MSCAGVEKNGAPLYGKNVCVPPVTVRGLNYIGKSYWKEGKFAEGIVGILLYNRALTVEQAAARHYIAEKYDLTVQ